MLKIVFRITLTEMLVKVITKFFSTFCRHVQKNSTRKKAKVERCKLFNVEIEDQLMKVIF